MLNKGEDGTASGVLRALRKRGVPFSASIAEIRDGNLQIRPREKRSSRKSERKSKLRADLEFTGIA
jgi:hypothetical protein